MINPSIKIKRNKSMKRNVIRFAAALLLTVVAITCSLTVWANPVVRGDGLAPRQTPAKGPLGTIGPTIAPPFDSSYSLFSLGSVPGVLTYYGGLTFKYDDPNTLLIGGAAGSPAGHSIRLRSPAMGTGILPAFRVTLHFIRGHNRPLVYTTTQASPLDRIMCSL
jgi:hypothetical protein